MQAPCFQICHKLMYGVVSGTFDMFFYFCMLMQVVHQCNWSTISRMFLHSCISLTLTFITLMTFWTTLYADYGVWNSLANIQQLLIFELTLGFLVYLCSSHVNFNLNFNHVNLRVNLPQFVYGEIFFVKFVDFQWVWLLY